MVEPMGFEPTTSSMPSRRAPNCATAPPATTELLNIYSIRERRASNKRGAECNFYERSVRRTNAKTRRRQFPRVLNQLYPAVKNNEPL